MIGFIKPVRIVDSKNIDDIDTLFLDSSLQVCLSPKATSKVTNGYMVLDFGKEIKGGVRILTSFFEGGNAKDVHVRFGESISEANSEIGENNATNDHSPRDFKYVLSMLSDVTLGQTGFRFVRIDFSNDVKCMIQGIFAYSEYPDNKPLYVYEGNDKDIKAIYDAAKRTIDLCSCGNYVWDGVKRDRLVWFGDLHPEMLALSTLYGRNKALENSLILATEQSPLGTWMNNFPTYSMWWLTNISDYYSFTKCTDFIKPLLPYAEGLVKQLDSFVKEDGEMNYPFYFVDWPTYQKEEEKIGSRIINIIAIKRIIPLFKEFNIDTKVAEHLLDKLLKADFTVKTKQIIGLKHYAFGSISDEEYNILIKDGSKGFSTFMSYYIINAIASKNKEKAISLMKEYYMGMINLGATTFFEDFDLEFSKDCGRIDEVSSKKDFHKTFGDYCYKGLRHSLCHGWSCGIIKCIMDNC